MAARGPRRWSAYAAAFLAVALFAFAFTQSVLMQAAGDMPAATMVICTGQGAVQMDVHHGVPAEKPQKACPFCAAASHAPLCAAMAPVPASSAVAWTAYAAMRPLGPRGPPAFEARARGPPQALLTI
jgi:hypothetical protein